MSFRLRRRELPAVELDCDMTPSDIAYELRQLDFDHSKFSAIRIDQEVRDYLVRSLDARHTTRRD